MAADGGGADNVLTRATDLAGLRAALEITRELGGVSVIGDVVDSAPPAETAAERATPVVHVRPGDLARLSMRISAAMGSLHGLPAFMIVGKAAISLKRGKSFAMRFVCLFVCLG
jgi:hypothetical protein